MPSIDDRIVKIEFDNSQFEQEIANTLQSLADLNNGLRLENSGQGEAALSGMASAVDNISSHFSALGAIGFSVIQTLTQGALGFIKKIGGDLLDPIIGGGLTRAKNIEQAKFMFEGLGIDVTAAMDSALKAVKGTAFGLDEAAKAAAQFGASGIAVGDDMTSALRGVAGAAALTGKGFTEIADIFAGSAGSGKVTNQDLLQFATRGLNAAAALGKVMGITEGQVHEMAANGELDFKTFAAAMDQAFGEHATSANKTFTGALANMKAALARLGASFIGPELTVFRDIFNALTPVIDNFAEAMKPVILVFLMISQVLGKEVINILNGISFDNLKAAMPAITRGLGVIFGIFQKLKLIAIGAFQRIFPPGGESVIVKMADAFEKFANWLDFGAKGASKVMSIFSGLFAILAIGWNIVKELAKFIWDLGAAIVGAIGGDTANGLAKVGEFLVGLKEALVDDGGIQDFFNVLREGLELVVGWIGKFKDAIGNMFGGFDKTAADAIETSTGRIGDRFQTLKAAVDKIKDLAGPVGDFAVKVGDALGKAWDAISEFFSGLGEKIAGILSSGAFGGALDALNTGLLAAMTASIIHWIKNGFNVGVGVNVDVGGGLIEKIKGTFDQLTTSLKTMQIKVKAEALLKIAYAIAILTASVLVLSLIDSAALTKALTAMAVGFAQLMGAFAILTKLTLDPKTAASFAALSVGFIILGVALLILAASAAIFARMDWDELARGLLGVAGALAILVISSKLLQTSAPGMIRAGIGLAALSVGLFLMATAVKVFATMSWSELGRGLLGLGVSLGAVIGAINLIPNKLEMVGAGLGLLFMSVGLIAIATALKVFASMSWDEIGRGLVGMAGGLLILLAPLAFINEAIPGGVALIGIGLILVAAGLVIFAGAMKTFGSMSWDEIARGLTALAGSLIILAIGITGMSGTLIGAIALGIVAGGLILLAGAMATLRGTSWDDMLDGLKKLAVTLGGLALISLLLAPAVPLIFALGLALTTIGIAFAIFGAGAFLAAKAFEVVGRSGAAGAEGVKAALRAIGESLTELGRGLAKGIIETIQVFADGIGKLIPAFSKIIGGLLTAMEKNLPKARIIFQKLLDTLIQLIYIYGPQFSRAGVYMLITMLQAIRDNIPLIVQTVSEIITGFFDAMSVEVPKIVTSLTNMIIEIMTSVAENYGKLSATLWPTLGIAFVSGFISGIESWLPKLNELLGGLPGKIIAWMGNALTFLYEKGRDLIQGILNGINANINTISGFFGGLPGQILGWIGNALGTLVQKGKDFITGLWNGAKEIFTSVTGWAGNLIQWIKDKITDPLGALKETGKDLIRGFKQGLEAIWDQVEAWIEAALDRLPAIVKKVLGIESPSKVFRKLGEYTSEGYFIGLKNVWDQESARAFNTDTMMTNINKSVQQISDAMNDVDLDVVPVITPVLDLTKVAEDAKTIQSYIPDGSIAPNTSLESARSIAFTATEVNPEKSPEGNSGVTFQQTINSPTQLATADIYKATRNQITIAKEELAIK